MSHKNPINTNAFHEIGDTERGRFKYKQVLHSLFMLERHIMRESERDRPEAKYWNHGY